MPSIAITRVRYDEAAAAEKLSDYLFAGHYGTSRPPRGIEPQYVSTFIREHVNPDRGPRVYQRSLEAMRFYERADLVEHLRQPLRGNEESGKDVVRSLYAVQAVGEMGNAEQADAAARYLDERIVPHRQAGGAFSLMLDTLVVIAPHGSPQRVKDRLKKDLGPLAEAQNRDEQSMRNYQALAFVQRNEVRAAEQLIAAKRRLLETPPDARRGELLDIYLRRSPFTNEYTETWAARMLRREAMEQDPQPVYNAFTAELNRIDPEDLPIAKAFTAVRSAQAILYLQGKLSPAHEELYEKALANEGASMNFLWDDPHEGGHAHAHPPESAGASPSGA